MPPDLDTIVCHARELSRDERAAYLEQACTGNAVLRAQLEGKLAELAEADAFFADSGATIVAPGRRVKEEAGTIIGPYKLLQQIGEGGFGTVWMAEQQQPVRRRVALKIIKAGMDTHEVVARFEQERQALAMMDHPNIAQVFDAGATETGRPYFVMELVRGIPVTRYCDEHKLGTRERLAIFADVCAAINHAHQKGVIHRDIKPSNVMVTLHGEKAVPKVIDFGIAKATQGRLTDKTLFTRFEQFIGTPVYMSPEQAALSGLDIDTRSDIYALGILLYELLTGRPPFDAQTLVSAGYDEMRRIIREDMPMPPSRMVRELTTRKGQEGHQGPEGQSPAASPSGPSSPSGPFCPSIPADLDLIVMKAIEKDRARRYETANAFAVDIQHYLADEPISASPPGATYLLRRFARRHKAALRVAALIAVLLVAGTITSTLLAIRAFKAEDKVKQERDAKQDTVRFVTNMLRSPDPARGDRNITVAKALDLAALEIESTFAGQPDRQASVRGVIGGSYAALGETQKALPLQVAARDFYLHAPEFGPEHEDTIEATAALAWTYDYDTQRKEAIALQRSVLAWYEAHRPAGHPDISKAMGALGRTLHFDGSVGEGFDLQKKAFDLSMENPGPAARQTMGLMHWLAKACGDSPAAEDKEEGKRLDLQLYQLCRQHLGDDHPETIRARSGATDHIEDLAERAAELERIEAQSARVNGEQHPYTLSQAAFRAITLRHRAKRAEAVIAQQGATPQLLHEAAQRTEAITQFDALLTRMKQHLGEQHADTLWVMSELAGTLEGRWKLTRGTPQEAVADRRRALELWQEAVRLSEVHLKATLYDTFGRKARLAEARDFDNQPLKALALREEILPLYYAHEKYGPNSGDTEWVRGALLKSCAAVIKLPGTSTAGATRLRELSVRLGRESMAYWKSQPPEMEGREYALRTATEQLARALHGTGHAAEAAEAAPLFAALGLTPPALARPGRTILRADGPWRWLHPDDGKDPGLDDKFAAKDFPDTAWKEDAPRGEGFGYRVGGGGFDGVDLGLPDEGQRHTAYFRCKFTTQESHTRLELRCRRDDGIIVYLDGDEVARDNMPAGLADTWLLPASGTVTEADCLVPLRAGFILPAGEHVLAISLHNAGPQSSDLLLGSVELVAVPEP